MRYAPTILNAIPSGVRDPAEDSFPTYVSSSLRRSGRSSSRASFSEERISEVSSNSSETAAMVFVSGLELGSLIPSKNC